MPKIENATKNARKIRPIIYVIDTSGSMAGTRIAAVNQAMKETIEVLKDISANNPREEFKIGVLQFASGASWVHDGLISIDDFYWDDLTAGGLTDLGAALDELDKKLSYTSFLRSLVGNMAPLLIFMSDGSPTDDYESALTNISHNNMWFGMSTKICIAIDVDSDLEVLQEIAGCGDKAKGRESVIQVSDMGTLKILIKFKSFIETWFDTKNILEPENTPQEYSLPSWAEDLIPLPPIGEGKINMPKLEDVTKPDLKILPIIFVIDTSGSMGGTRIAAVNQAMKETIEVLKDVSAKNPTTKLIVGVLQYASSACWVTNEERLVAIDDLHWNDLTTGGRSNLGAALNELHQKMSRKAFFPYIDYQMPVLIFMSDGVPTDDYKSALQKITDNNEWFLKSTIFPITIDEASNVEVLQEIAGRGDKAKGRESVIQLGDVEILNKLIMLSSDSINDNPYNRHPDWYRSVSRKTELARKIIPIIYVIDTSGDMVGTRMATLNKAMTETIEVLKEVSAKNPTAELKIGVLQYGGGARWVTGKNELVAIDDFYWNDLTTGGTADLGAALEELHKKMSGSAFFNSEFDYSVPFLLIMSNGGPTDDYKSALKKISDNNKWFTASTKIFLAIDTDSDVEVLQEIAGCGEKAKGRESVVQVSDMETLKMLIKIFSVIATKTGVASKIDFDYTYETIEFINGLILDSDADEVIMLSDFIFGGPGHETLGDDWGRGDWD